MMCLRHILRLLEKIFSHSGDASEIVEDIENAISEKFVAKKKSEKHAVTTGDIASIIKEMGSPC